MPNVAVILSEAKDLCGGETKILRLTAQDDRAVRLTARDDTAVHRDHV
jgi:hypothetical protein